MFTIKWNNAHSVLKILYSINFLTNDDVYKNPHTIWDRVGSGCKLDSNFTNNQKLNNFRVLHGRIFKDVRVVDKDGYIYILIIWYPPLLAHNEDASKCFLIRLIILEFFIIPLQISIPWSIPLKKNSTSRMMSRYHKNIRANFLS